ncbi:MAG: hypothetical protein OEQ74_05825 [Gammaproteobacteria bacterium]|nr:hypothetical protein [Gammaproteobacteria bacterium]
MTRIIAPLALCSVVIGGCVHQEVITINATPANAAVADVSEGLLLDVGITIFDANVPDEIKEQNELRLVAGVRTAEARYMPYVLRDTLQKTGHWGAVRVVPRASDFVDLMVAGRIETSDGEMLVLSVTAYDATGRLWIDDKEYSDLAGKLNYREDINTTRQDPFQDLYNQIANDLLAKREAMALKDVNRIREVAQLRFAADISPDAFGKYIEEDDGRVQLSRLPARDDPMLQRVQKIRERDNLFIDTLDQHYGVFYQQVKGAYSDWRRFNYDEVVELRRLEREIRRRTIAGAALIVGGLAVDANSDSNYASYAGRVGALVGLSSILSTMPLRPEALVHAETMRELGDTFDAEVRPAVLEVEGKTITLSGSVDSQFEQWRDLLRDIYVTETGLPEIEGQQGPPDG